MYTSIMGEAAWFQILNEQDEPSGLIIIGESFPPDGVDPYEIAREGLAIKYRLERIPVPHQTEEG